MGNNHGVTWIESLLAPLLFCINGVVSVLCKTEGSDGKTAVLVVIRVDAFHPSSSAVLATFTGVLAGQRQVAEGSVQLQMLPLRPMVLKRYLNLEGEWEVLA